MSPASRRRLPLALSAVVAACTLALTGCTLPEPNANEGDSSPQTEQLPVAEEELSVEVRPADSATDVSVVDGVGIDVSNAEITEAVLTNDAGEEIEGDLDSERTSWEPDVMLGYGREYTLTSTVKGDDGEVRTDTRSFTTDSPQSIATPSLVTTGGTAIEDDREYGVGMVVVASFDSPVLDREGALDHMNVTTEPEVDGEWYWLNESSAHWRPEEYYEPGTRVEVDLETDGRELGEGQFGGDDASVGFTIGESRVAVADDETKQVEVYHDDELVRTMNTSFGVGGWGIYGGVEMHFWTQPGVYTVLGKEASLLMDSSSYGLPTSDPWGYSGWYNNGVRISNNGIYFHENSATVWAQGNTNTSHGCLNLNTADAQWYFDQAVIGDVVEIVNTDGPPLEQWKNGDWSVSWDEWQTGGFDDA